jgi:ribosomal protein L40E
MDQGMDVSSCVPIYVNQVPEIDLTFNDLKEGQINVMKPLTEEMIFDNTHISNSLMTFSEYYLAYRFAESGNVDVILLDRSMSNTYSSLLYGKVDTLICSKCAKTNPCDSNFCNACGSPFSLSCSTYVHTNPYGALFCGKCGSNRTTMTMTSLITDNHSLLVFSRKVKWR